MSYLENVYRPRLNKDGTTFNERVLNKRRKNFAHYAQNSNYRIEFDYGEDYLLGVLIPNRQDQKKVSGFLETSYNNKIAIGSIINHAEDNTDWLVIYLEANISAAWNRYFVILINGEISWTEANTKTPVYTSKCYKTGPMDGIIKDRFLSSGENSSYLADEKAVGVLLPYNEHLNKQSYVTITGNGKKEYFTITGINSTTTEGLIYISLEARPERDETIVSDPTGPWLNR